MANKWIKRILAALVVGGMGTCGVFALADRLPPEPVTVAEVEAAFDQPIHEPGMSLPLVDQGVVPVVDGRARADVTIPPRECLFALVGGATPLPFDSIALFETESHESLISQNHERVAGLGWCAAGEPLDLTLWAQGDAIPEADLTEAGEGSMVYRFRMGLPSSRWQAYIAGNPVPEKLEALTTARGEDAGELRDAQSAPAAEPLLRADVAPDMALALPRSEGTRWTASALGTIGRPRDFYAPRLQGARGASAGDSPPVALIDERYLRLLLVIDPSDLPVDGPVPCVRVHFSRLGGEARQVERLPIPSLDATTDTEHRVCPGDPLSAFVTDASDGAAWRVRVLRAEGPTAERRPSAPPEAPLIAPAHQATRAACEGGDSAACAAAAQQLAVGRFVTPDPEEARRLGDRACRADAEHCGTYGDLLHDQADDEGAFEAWSRGCHAGNDGWACATLGEAYRFGDGHPFDARSAADAFSKACRLGIEGACRHERTMALLQLDS